MPRYRYEAIDQSGVPIHGTADAATEEALSEQLAERRQRLVSASELSLDSMLGANRTLLPRLFQLRIGEQLREALLTGLPAHQAVRAIAAEPLSHPMLGMMPWLHGTAVVILLAFYTANRFTGEFQTPVLVAAVFALGIIPTLYGFLKWLYQTRPRQLLHSLANRLESGESLDAGLSAVMPSELRLVMKSDVKSDAKARVAADLVPGSVGGHHQTQQFVMTLIGPLVLLCVMFVGIYTTLLIVIPKFKTIFEDFGTELPAMTMIVVNISDVVVAFGSIGWVVFSLMCLLSLVVLAVLLAGGHLGELLENVPVFGMAFRWAMQAKVARVLSAMIRNECPYPESVRTATAAGGFRQVKLAGEVIAKSLETGGRPVAGTMDKLSGLPVSMLFADASNIDQSERRVALADTFHSLSEMLDAATVGQGRLFALLIQFALVFFTGFVVAFGVLAMFLPLIKLLNDLS